MFGFFFRLVCSCWSMDVKMVEFVFSFLVILLV